MRNILNIVVIYFTATAMIFSHAMPVHAGLVSTDQLLTEQVINQDRAKLYEIINRNEAKKLLEKNGVSKLQAEERIAALTNEEIQVLTENFEELPAGGVGSAAAILILVLLGIILVLAK